jgi:ATP-dependent Zn protease
VFCACITLIITIYWYRLDPIEGQIFFFGSEISKFVFEIFHENLFITKINSSDQKLTTELLDLYITENNKKKCDIHCDYIRKIIIFYNFEILLFCLLFSIIWFLIK